MVVQDFSSRFPAAATHAAGVGRDDVLASCERALASGNLCLSGPAGIGKTTILVELQRAAAKRGEVTLLGAGTIGIPPVPGGLLSQLRRRIPDHAISRLSSTTRAALAVTDGRSTAECAEAWAQALESHAAGNPLSIFIDDVADVDADSVQLLSSVFRQLNVSKMRIVLAARRVPPSVNRMAPSPVAHVGVPPLSPDAVATIIEQYGLPAKFAGALHTDSAGNPSLLVALAGALSHQHTAALTPEMLSPMVAALVHDRLDGLDEEVVASLRLCALATSPTITLLQRCGRTNAADEIWQAVDRGLVALNEDTIGFTPSSAARVVQAGVTGAEQTELHQLLADAVPTQEERLRHLALAAPEPDSDFAKQLAEAAHSARERGFLRLGAELYVLAADRSTSDLSEERSEWLVQAANLAASVGDDYGTHSASERALKESSSASHRVQARLAEIRLAGHSTQSMTQALTTAQQDAESDSESMTSVLLWQAWVGMLAGDLDSAIKRGEEAAAMAEAHGDTTSCGFAWAVSATAARLAGRPDARERIDRALETETKTVFERLHLSPAYMSARFDIVDDELERATATLARLRAKADRGGPVEKVAVMRSTLEADLMAGRCSNALETAQAITNLAARNGLSPGPSWYTAALAELTAGSTSRAAAYASQGVRSCEHDKDMIFARCNLHALAIAYARAGQLAEAIATFEKLAQTDNTYGVADPTNVRYHADFAAAYVALEEHQKAREVISWCRELLRPFPQSRSVPAMLDRTEAILASASGDFDVACSTLDRVAETFAALGLVIEQGKTYLIHAQTARSRRRYAAARGLIANAEALFQRAGAWAWINQCHSFRSHLDGQSPDRGSNAGSTAISKLSEAELRIARLVAQGATNKEIAQRLYLSVKTVEATLTRVYRKVGVRSRTQLSAQLGGK